MRPAGGVGNVSSRLREARAIVVSTFVLATTPSFLFAQNTETVSSIWNRFQTVCVPALADPQAWVDKLPATVPAGTYGIVTSPDGKMYKVNVANNRFFDSFEVVVFEDVLTKSCSISFNGEGIPKAAETASQFENLLQTQHPNAPKIGGLYPEQYRQYDGSQGDQIFLNEANYQYRIRGVAHVPQATTFVQIVDGYMSVSASERIVNLR